MGINDPVLFSINTKINAMDASDDKSALQWKDVQKTLDGLKVDGTKDYILPDKNRSLFIISHYNELRKHDDTHSKSSVQDKSEAAAKSGDAPSPIQSEFPAKQTNGAPSAEDQKKTPEDKRADPKVAAKSSDTPTLPHGLNEAQMKDIAAMRNAGSFKVEHAETASKDHSAPVKKIEHNNMGLRA